jgi:DnaK suppressor protein
MELERSPDTSPKRLRSRQSRFKRLTGCMQMLNETDLKQVEGRLLEERKRAVDALADFDRERVSSLLDDTGELTLYRLHPADIGSESMELEIQFLLGSNEGRRLYQIDDALRRLYQTPESFGVCQNCGRDIEIERLDVVPEATMCVVCQRLAEEEA